MSVGFHSGPKQLGLHSFCWRYLMQCRGIICSLRLCLRHVRKGAVPGRQGNLSGLSSRALTAHTSESVWAFAAVPQLMAIQAQILSLMLCMVILLFEGPQGLQQGALAILNRVGSSILPSRRKSIIGSHCSPCSEAPTTSTHPRLLPLTCKEAQHIIHIFT